MSRMRKSCFGNKEVYLTHEMSIPLTNENLMKVAKLNRDFAEYYNEMCKDSDCMMSFDFHRKIYQSITVFIHSNHPKEYMSISITYYCCLHKKGD